MSSVTPIWEVCLCLMSNRKRNLLGSVGSVHLIPLKFIHSEQRQGGAKQGQQLKSKKYELKLSTYCILPFMSLADHFLHTFGSVTETHRGRLCVMAANEVLAKTLPS